MVTRHAKGNNPWLSRFVLCIFLAICATYFLLCRRLILAFEWTFLAGFVAVAPPLALARKRLQASWIGAIKQIALVTVAFTAFYAISVGLLWWKYMR